jgi:hypothetical protein
MWSDKKLMFAGPLSDAIQRVLQDQHLIMVSHEYQRLRFRYQSFESMEAIHSWMCSVGDKHRHACLVDLSALSPAVPPLVCSLEWMSIDKLPDPLTSERLRVFKQRILTALQPYWKSNVQPNIEVTDFSVVGDGQYTNVVRVVVPSVVFEHNTFGCMKDFVQLELLPLLDVDVASCVDLSIYKLGWKALLPGCCGFGSVGRPVLSLAELQCTRTTFDVQPPGTILVTVAMLWEQKRAHARRRRTGTDDDEAVASEEEEEDMKLDEPGEAAGCCETSSRKRNNSEDESNHTLAPTCSKARCTDSTQRW